MPGVPFIGTPLVVLVTPTPFGSLVALRNNTGSQMRLTVNGRRLLLHGNSAAGTVVEAPPDQVVVFDDGEQVWPRLDSPA